MNPLVPFSHGWEQVARTLEDAASQIRVGEVQGVENIVTYATPELGFIVEVERAKMTQERERVTRGKVGAAFSLAIRLTGVVWLGSSAGKRATRHFRRSFCLL